AKRTAGRCGADTAHLLPRVHRRLVEAIRAGSRITERVLIDGMTDKDAYRLESELIAAFHGARTDPLWNTIDERDMDRGHLPKQNRDPEHPNYKVRRPLIGVESASAGTRRTAAASPEIKRIGMRVRAPKTLRC